MTENTTLVNNELSIKFASKSLFGEAAEAKAKEILEAIPSAILDTMQSLSDTEKVLKYFDQYFAIAEGAKTPAAQGQTNVGAATIQEASMPAAARKAFDNFDRRTMAARREKAAKTKITHVHIDKPWAGEYLDPNTKVIPEVKEDKLKEYEKMLVDTPENRADFERAVKAIQNKEAVAIAIPDKEKYNARILGVEVTTPASKEGTGNLITRDFTMNSLIGFVQIELASRIANNKENKEMGCVVGTAQRKTKKNAALSSSGKETVPVIKLSNKKEALTVPGFGIVISKPKEENGKKKTKEGRVATELSFKVKTGKTNQKGEETVRTVKIYGKTQVPVWERIDAKYEKLYSVASKDRDVVTPLSDAELQATADERNKILYLIQQNPAAYGAAATELAAEIASTTVASTDTSVLDI